MNRKAATKHTTAEDRKTDAKRSAAADAKAESKLRANADIKSDAEHAEDNNKTGTDVMANSDGKNDAVHISDDSGKTDKADKENSENPDDKIDAKRRTNSEALRERVIRANAGKLCRTWLKQADETSGIYPGFNFHRELQNPRFCAILKNGIDVRTAYEVIHHDEIIPAALRCAVLDAEKKLANKIMSNEARPTENGSGAGAGATLGTGVSKMSKANRDDIVRRVMRGEIIRL